MLTNLDGIENSEFNNAGDLYGVDSNGMTEELLGMLGRMNPIQRQKAINQLARPAAPSRGSRAEMEKHFRELPQHIKDQLIKGDLRLADTIVYSIKPVTSKTTRIFEPQDTREVGLRSLSEGRLPKGQALLVSGIFLLFGVAASDSKDDQMRTVFGAIDPTGALANGEFSLKANKKIIVPEGTPNRLFCTNNQHGVPTGYFKLANPRLIHDDVSIEFTIELGTTTGIVANTQVFVGLQGTITTP
jgi:hypothetical protein